MSTDFCESKVSKAVESPSALAFRAGGTLATALALPHRGSDLMSCQTTVEKNIMHASCSKYYTYCGCMMVHVFNHLHI